jgi:hypothetical protein
MSARGRHVTTAVTLVILVGILAGGLWLGSRAFLAPLPGDDATDAPPSCSPRAVKQGQRIAPRQVQVSVFNAGTRAGLAGDTLDRLARRGFRKGEAGNAPPESRVKVAQIWTTQRNDAAARLVARQFARPPKVRVVTTDLGPGVDVVVGDDFTKLGKVVRAIVVKRPSSACLPGSAD